MIIIAIPRVKPQLVNTNVAKNVFLDDLHTSIPHQLILCLFYV